MKFSKQEYIIRSFAKLKHKQWELYVVTRVFHLLNDLNIEFVCQQPVLSGAQNDRHLVDMFFPQFNICLEIDEEYHQDEHQRFKDREREKKILERRTSEIGVEGDRKLKIERINVAQFEDPERNLTAVNFQTDTFVAKLRKLKKQNKTTIWDFETKFSATPFIEKGYLRTDDRPRFNSQKTALECFGYAGGNYQKATWPNDTKRFGFQVWFVRLTKHKDWHNSLSDNGLVLTETLIKKCEVEEHKQLKNNRNNKKCVFVRKKDDLARTMYRFVGMFEKTEGPGRNADGCLQWKYQRISAEVKLP